MRELCLKTRGLLLGCREIIMDHQPTFPSTIPALRKMMQESRGAAIRLLDAAGNCVLVNDEYCRLTGRNCPDLEGKPFTAVYCTEDAGAQLEQFQRRLRAATGKALSSVAPCVYCFQPDISSYTGSHSSSSAVLNGGVVKSSPRNLYLVQRKTFSNPSRTSRSAATTCRSRCGAARCCACSATTAPASRP